MILPKHLRNPSPISSSPLWVAFCGKLEVEALAEHFGEENVDNEPLQWRLPKHHHNDTPSHFVQLSSEEIACNIAKPSILVNGMYELWGEGTCYEKLRDSIKSYPDSRKLPFLTCGSTCRISVETFGKALTSDEQKDQIYSLTYIPFEGRVNLKNPDDKFFSDGNG